MAFYERLIRLSFIPAQWSAKQEDDYSGYWIKFEAVPFDETTTKGPKMKPKNRMDIFIFS